MSDSRNQAVTDAQLQALVAVADNGSFTRAARQLQMSQSAVSHAITGLEAALGVRLLLRSPRGVQFTAVGERTVTHGREVLRLKSLMRYEAETERTLRSGVVRVGSFGPTASRLLLPPILQLFGRGYPHIKVSVTEGSDPEVVEWLRSGTVDVGFVTLPNEEFDTSFLAEDEMNVLLSADHPLALERRIQPQWLAAYPFIMSTGGCEPAIQAILNEAEVDVRYHIREVHTIVDMVARRAGISIKPVLSLPDPLPAAVVRRSLDPPRPRRIGLATTRRQDLSPAVRAFMRVAASTHSPVSNAVSDRL